MAFVPALPLPPVRRRFTTASVDSKRRAVPTACTSQNISRRSALSLSAALAAALLLDNNKSSRAAITPATKAAAVSLGAVVTNDPFGYSYKSPGVGWSKNITSLSSGRTATIFLRDADGDSNISVVSTPVPGDFAKISSFGTLDGVLTTILPPKKENIEGQLVSSRIDNSKNAYVYEYTITQKGVKRHLYTIFSLKSGSYLNTLTGQSKEEVWPEVEGVIKAVADSFEIEEET